MKIVVIGGTGHIGSFLTPMLVEAGYEVTVISRSGRTPVPDNGIWRKVKLIEGFYKRDSLEWQELIARIKTEVVIDILGNDLWTLYETVKRNCKHLVACGSVWMFGDPKTVPTPETTQGPCRFEGYAWRYSEMLKTKKQALKEGVMFTAIMPPNICGPGKIPLEVKGGRDIKVQQSLMHGEAITLPLPGSNLIGPCDAEDVARAFFLAVQNREAAADEIFNVGAPYSVTIRRFVEIYEEIYEVKLPIAWVEWEKFTTTTVTQSGAYYHFQVNMCPDITKINSVLGFSPKYTTEETLSRAVDWIREEGVL